MSPNTKRIEYTFKPIGEERFFNGYQLIVTYPNQQSFTVEQSYPIEDQRIVYVDFDLTDILDGSNVLLQVKSAQGKYMRLAPSTGDNVPEQDSIPIQVNDLANATINVAVEAFSLLPNPVVNGSYRIKGKLISNRSAEKLEGYQVVIFASTTGQANGSSDFSPVAFATTEENGYFVTSFLLFNNPDDIVGVQAAKAVITNGDLKKEQPIKLVEKTESQGGDPVTKSMIPERLILVIDETNPEEDCVDCGCNDLNFHDKKVFEEYSFHTVVRTTEPAIIADVLEEDKPIDMGEIYGYPKGQLLVPFSVFKKYHTIASRQVNSDGVPPVGLPTPGLPTTNLPTTNLPTTNLPAVAADNQPGGPALLASNTVNGNVVNETALRSSLLARTVLGPARAGINATLLDNLLLQHDVNKVIKADGEDPKPAVLKGRTYLNQLYQIDWDDEPTIYQAASIAHGHLLHFKQEWMPDGYSIGELVYSLPLAPGQKKQIAVLDWERRESAANSQSLDYEESLNNSLARDRVVSDIVNGTLTENIRGNSRAYTAGGGFGMGSSVMGIIPGVGSFGSLLGISGGGSVSGSNASQSSQRESTASSLQNITDRTMQSASVVRSQRSTVVQTVSQGERVQATAESVANYNHCHAITIEYFEVLRHFAVRTRLADVQECLFVPLQMTPFDLQKCLRWRNTLEKHLFRRELRSAFESVARLQHEKEGADNYYDSIGFPKKNYAEQSITQYEGEIYLEFYFFKIQDKIDDELVSIFNIFGIDLKPYKDADRLLTNNELAEIVGPRTIEFLLDAISVEVQRSTGFEDLKMDLTLVSTFRPQSPLYISLRQGVQTDTSIPRDQITGIRIKLDPSKINVSDKAAVDQLKNKYMKVKMRSGALRYRTSNFSGALFSNSRVDNDLFASDDGVFISTPLTAAELRNPRAEDLEAANNLIHHLNENLEYYHKCIFFDMTPERRFMLLDGIIAPGKANGRSVASVVENRVIGIAGNSLIMPVAPGNQLDPTIDDTFDLFAQYYTEEPEPVRISIPTKGVYAEAVMGQCNSCEEKDESRFWRWEESPIPDSPSTQILPLNTDTRRADPGNLDPKDFPNPVVNIQNAPALPDPSGISALLQLLGKGDSFRDLTGLNQNQLNALATFQKSLDTAQAFGKEAAELAKAAAANKLIEDAQKSGAVTNQKAKELTEKNLKAAIPQSKEETMGEAQKQLDLIKTLEEQGSLSPKAAQNARKNILDNLTKGIDTSGTSAGELGNLMENASKFGTDVKKDGDAFEISTKNPNETNRDLLQLANFVPNEVTALVTASPSYQFVEELERQLFGDPANPNPAHPLNLSQVADILERSLYGMANFEVRLSSGGAPIRGLHNSAIYRCGNLVIFQAKASTDTDGRVDPGTDPDHRSDTSYTVQNSSGARIFLDGMSNNYFVINSDVQNKVPSMRAGDFGLVRNNTNSTVCAAVYGDFQPGHSAGEISFGLANNLGYGLDPAKAGRIDADPNDTPGALYIIFVGSTHNRRDNEVSNAALATESQSLLRTQLKSYIFYLMMRAMDEAQGFGGIPTDNIA